MNRPGLHHVTAIAGPAARNVDFYTRALGLRLVKKTVNFDDPGTYHLYYGDGDAAPGTILTFFPWEHAAPGRLGVGETRETVFRAPVGQLSAGSTRSSSARWASRNAGSFSAWPSSAFLASRPSRPGRSPASGPSTPSAASTASA